MHTLSDIVILAILFCGTLAAPFNMAKARTIVPTSNRSTNTSGSQTGCTDGQLVCSSDGSQFGICSWGQVTFQDVAAGTACRNGAIVAASSAVTNSVPVRSSRAAPVRSSAASKTKTTTSMAYSYTPTTAANRTTSATRSPSSTPAAASSTPRASSAESSAATGPTTSATGLPGTDYHVYLGNGEPSQGWPEMSAWAAFDYMWAKNAEYTINGACAAFGAPENTAQNTADLKSAILAESNSTGIDPRFIFAIVMQESTGCVRVDTTFGSVANPGLMQSHDGSSTCYQQATCPASEIQGMIKDGVQGTSTGDGLQQLLQQTNTTGVAMYYRAARMYNSGSIASNGLLQCGVATNSYASDIANRLTMSWYRGTRTFPTNICPDSGS